MCATEPEVRGFRVEKLSERAGDRKRTGKEDLQQSSYNKSSGDVSW